MSARWMVIVGLTMSLAGCARSRPQVEPDLPPLAAPLPPARELPPLEGGPIEGAVTTDEQPPPAPRPAPRRRSETPRTTTESPTRPDQGAPASETPAETNAPASPPPVLQLTPPGEEARVEQAVRQQLTRARGNLGHVDYRALGIDARAQYDTAIRFAQLAEQAIKDRNLIFAQTLADKAAAIAEVLVRR